MHASFKAVPGLPEVVVTKLVHPVQHSLIQPLPMLPRYVSRVASLLVRLHAAGTHSASEAFFATLTTSVQSILSKEQSAPQSAPTTDDVPASPVKPDIVDPPELRRRQNVQSEPFSVSGAVAMAVQCVWKETLNGPLGVSAQAFAAAVLEACISNLV